MSDTTFRDPFIDYMHQQMTISEKSEGGYRLWTQIKRDFRNVYTANGDVACYVHFLNANVSLHDGYPYEVRKLIGFMYAKQIIALKGGVSLGTAMKNCDRNEKAVNALVASNKIRLISELKNMVSLFASKDVKLDAYRLTLNLFAWESQERHATNHNWIRKAIVTDYCRRNNE